MSMQIDDPKFALRYWPVRDTILALSAHYKRRPTDPNDPFLEIGDLKGGRGAVIELSKEDTLALARGSYLYEAAEIVVRSKRPGIHPPEGE